MQKLEPSGDLEKHTRGVTNEFSRVVDCEFGEFRMRLGSDLVLFRNEKDEAVSLHLWDDLRVITSPLEVVVFHLFM